MIKKDLKILLQEIQADDIDSIYRRITNNAADWVGAGFIEEANNLLEQLWNFNIPHSRHVWLIDQGLQVIWEIAGKKPSNIPFQFIDISQIEQDNWERSFLIGYDSSYTSRIMKQPLEELHGLDLYVKAITSAGEQSESNIKILENLKRLIGNGYTKNYPYLSAITCGALLAANQNQDELARYFIQQWGKAYLSSNLRFGLPSLMSYRKTAIYLHQGILKDIFNISSDSCLMETDQIIASLSKRIAIGRTLIYGHLSLPELLNRISSLAIEQKTIEFSEEIIKKGTLLKPPAKASEISDTENRLKITLPDVYKDFLLISNGFECFSTTDVTISDVQSIDYLINVDQELINIWTDEMDDIDPSFGEKLKSSIIIGGHQEEQQLLLIPSKGSNWECWHFSSWRPGEASYQDFRYYMEELLQRLENASCR